MAKQPRIAAKSVDEYLAALPEDVKLVLEQLPLWCHTQWT
jgi:hypothetical protein